MSAVHLNGDGHSEVLSFEESTRFSACETIIGKGLQTFVEVGKTLLKIKNDETAFGAKCQQLGISTEQALDFLKLAENFK
jgi:hypothetical protein